MSVLVLLASVPQRAGAHVFDRAEFLKPSTAVSDDPRRVPAPPSTLVYPVIALVNGRVLDGSGAEARPGGVLIAGGKIVRILAAGTKDIPADARVIDVRGATIMPGLIDLHVHMTYTEPGVEQRNAINESDQTLRAIERLRFYMESGITTVRDMGSQGDVPFRIKAWVKDNRLPLPRVYAAGQLITGTGGHGAEGLDINSPIYGEVVEVSGPDAWRDEVRRQYKRGADFIKLASHFSRAEVAAAVDEAHSLGLKVAVDAETQYIEWAVEAGADIIEHPLPRSKRTIALMAKQGTISVPTLVPYAYIFDIMGGYYNSTSRRFSFSKEDNLKLTREMWAAGIRMGVGTDLVFDWFRFLPNSYISELKLLTQAGFTTREVLVAATRTNAEILGMGDKLGTIAAGKLADIIVVAGKPDENLDDLRNLSLVIRDGHVVVEDGHVVIPPHVPRNEPEQR